MLKMLLLILVAIMSQTSFGVTYQVAYQKGKVEILRAGKSVSPPVETGDVVKVHKGGLLVLKSSQEVLKLLEDTEIKALEEKEETIISLIRGALVSQVTKKSFKVNTRTTSFGVRGTQFFVQSQQGSEAWMCVKEGIVNATTGKNSVDVPAGKGIFADGKDISKPQAYGWTKGINWKMDAAEGSLEHKINPNYDLLENFYD